MVLLVVGDKLNSQHSGISAKKSGPRITPRAASSVLAPESEANFSWERRQLRPSALRPSGF